jgi:uncharacterized damage-inducible protein DinB
MTEERPDPPKCADERTMLESWLEFHRATLGAKCAGLTPGQLRQRAVEPSSLSLLGLVRHMAEVERGWFRRCLAGETLTAIWNTRENPDADFDDVDGADCESDTATWRDECARARAVMSGIDSLDHTGERRGQEISARWVMVHMIEEYARHNGHADFLRERIDGATGY